MGFLLSPARVGKHRLIMKPRIIVACTTLPDGRRLELHEHDGAPYLHLHGEQVIGGLTAAAEEELARTACAPFRPARQPRVLVLGLGLGRVLRAALDALPQQRASFFVAEPLADLVGWHREGLAGLDPAAFDDQRLSWINEGPAAALHALPDPPHAILLHLDAVPAVHESRAPGPSEDPGWLSAAHDILLPGGLLALGAARPQAKLTTRLRKAGFDVVESKVQGSPGSRKPRPQPLWFARKPGR